MNEDLLGFDLGAHVNSWLHLVHLYSAEICKSSDIFYQDRKLQSRNNDLMAYGIKWNKLNQVETAKQK